jgi:CysZ protein
MRPVLGALGYAAANLLHPRMLWLMLWPMLVAAGIWGIAALFLWVRTALRIAEIIQEGLEVFHLQAPDAALIAAHAVLFLLFVPLVWLTALFILGVFGMAEMVDHVAAASFPDLERRHGGGLPGSIANGIATLIGMLLLAVVTLPLWILVPLWPLIPLVIFAWANQRLLRYDALADHAERREMRLIFRQRRGHLYLLGLLMALLAYVPVLGFIAPVLFGLAFIRYLLGALAGLRAAAPGAPA